MIWGRNGVGVGQSALNAQRIFVENDNAGEGDACGKRLLFTFAVIRFIHAAGEKMFVFCITWLKFKSSIIEFHV